MGCEQILLKVDSLALEVNDEFEHGCSLFQSPGCSTCSTDLLEQLG